MTSDEALKELNSGASPATLCMRLIASLSECEKARDAAVQELGLERMNGDVISQIRAELKERYGEECTFFDDAVRHVCVTLEKRAEKAEAESSALRLRLEVLTRYAEMDAYCPCCEQTTVCLPDCTFKDDDNEGYKLMVVARVALAGERPGEGGE